MDVTRQKWGTRRGRGNCSLNPEVFVIELFLRDVLIYAFWKVSKSVKQERSAVKSPGSFTRFISVRNFSTAKIDRFAFVDVHHPRSLPDIFSKVSAADVSFLSLSLSLLVFPSSPLLRFFRPNPGEKIAAKRYSKLFQDHPSVCSLRERSISNFSPNSFSFKYKDHRSTGLNTLVDLREKMMRKYDGDCNGRDKLKLFLWFFFGTDFFFFFLHYINIGGEFEAAEHIYNFIIL